MRFNMIRVGYMYIQYAMMLTSNPRPRQTTNITAYMVMRTFVLSGHFGGEFSFRHSPKLIPLNIPRIFCRHFSREIPQQSATFPHQRTFAFKLLMNVLPPTFPPPLCVSVSCAPQPMGFVICDYNYRYSGSVVHRCNWLCVSL